MEGGRRFCHSTGYIHNQFIHYFFQDKMSGFKCVLTVIYGSNNLKERKELREGLNHIGVGITMLWCMCRDCNSIFDSKDRIWGGHYKAVVDNLNLLDMKAMERQFT